MGKDFEIQINPKLDESTNSNTTDIKSFHYLEDGSIDFSIMSTQFTKKKLECGVYNVGVKETSHGAEIDLKLVHHQESYKTDMEFYFDDKINKYYEAFFNKDVIKRVHGLGYKHKMGILLYGKQGTGKTTMFKKYFNRTVDNHNGLVFVLDISNTGYITFIWSFIKKIRIIQNNPIVIFLDEVDEAFLKDISFESNIKTIMDGMKSIDNCMFFLATNYIDKIPKTIRERPSRIKYCIEVSGIDDIDKIKKFLDDNLKSIGVKYEIPADEIKNLKGSTLDELKQWLLDRIMDIK